MSQHRLYAVCPRCFTPFVLKGSRLRRYEQAILRNPAMKGPYCSYHCSCRSNIENAPTLLKKKQKETELLAKSA